MQTHSPQHRQGIHAGGDSDAAACLGVWSSRFRLPCFFAIRGVSLQSRVVGVTHPIKSLPDVRRTDARSAQICRPDGVLRTFQVSEYSIEPSKGIRTCNLLTKNDCRAAL